MVGSSLSKCLPEDRTDRLPNFQLPSHRTSSCDNKIQNEQVCSRELLERNDIGSFEGPHNTNGFGLASPLKIRDTIIDNCIMNTFKSLGISNDH